MTHRRRLFGLAMTLLLSITLLTGCWDRTETNDIAFVLTSRSIWRTTADIASPICFRFPASMGGASGGGGGTAGAKATISIRRSERPFAKRSVSFKCEWRRIFLSHRRTIVIGENWQSLALIHVRCPSASPRLG